MSNLRVVELKAFVPATDYARSTQFYRELGFTMASEGGGVAYFHAGTASFLLQDGGAASAEPLVLHLLVENVDDWHRTIRERQIPQRYQVRLGEIRTQAWRMRDFELEDPSGVLWLIAQNVD